jgi:methylated-DNA-[protein]-cysteine S-methyltransferase
MRFFQGKLITRSRFGPVGVAWAEVEGLPKLLRVFLSRPAVSAADDIAYLPVGSCAAIDAVAVAIEAFLSGEAVMFSLDIVHLQVCPPFQRAVLAAQYRIPRGKMSTYRIIGEHLGKNNSARAVGNALAKNPFPLIIPCHRTVRSDLQVGGFQGGPEMKRLLLAQEGIGCASDGRVVCRRFWYQKANT